MHRNRAAVNEERKKEALKNFTTAEINSNLVFIQIKKCLKNTFLN
jgi:hypothetical protein